MPTLLGPAIDPTASSPVGLEVSAWPLAAPLPPVLPPGPGDPDVEWDDPIPSAEGLTVQVQVLRAVTREPVGWLESAEVKSWDEDVEVLAGSRATVECAGNDPLFDAMATRTWIGSDGWPCYEWDPRDFIAHIYEDGVAVWTGMPWAPVSIGEDRVVLPLTGPQEVWTSDFLGRVEQLDLLNGAGDFEGVPLGEMPPGWVAIPDAGSSIDAGVVPDPLRGAASLATTGSGFIRSPKVLVIGQEGVKRIVEGAAFGKWATTIPDGEPTIVTYCQRVDSLAKSNIEASLADHGSRPKSEGRWSQDPVVSKATLSSNAVLHWVWLELRSFPDVETRYDVATLRQGVLSGSLIERDLSWYVWRLVADLADPAIGGSPHGITVQYEPCGTTVQQVWQHPEHHTAMDALRMVFDLDGGPEAWISTSWVMRVVPRLGQDRYDIALTDDVALGPAWEITPADQVDDFHADTGRGSGASALFVSVEQPQRPDRHRTARLVPAPKGRHYNLVASWARRHARAAARIQISHAAEVPYWFAKLVAKGDTLQVCVSMLSQGLDRRMRVVNIEWFPESMTAVLSMAPADA